MGMYFNLRGANGLLGGLNDPKMLRFSIPHFLLSNYLDNEIPQSSTMGEK